MTLHPASFVFQGRIPRVVFGAGSLSHLERELEVIKAQSVLLLCTPRQKKSIEEICKRLGSRCAGIFANAEMHVPIAVADEGSRVARETGADCLVAIGGGSTIGLAKAIALTSSLPILAIPTTYSGSEMTPIYGVTRDQEKKTGRSDVVLPKAVIYDPDLTMNLPVATSVTSGINAIAHAAEGLYARDANPVMSAIAEEGMRALVRGLPQLLVGGDAQEARADCLYGSWLCGVVLGNVGMGLHHKLCHTLGGTFNLPHAETHSVILPYVLAYNADAAPHAMARIAQLFSAANAAQAMFDFECGLGAPQSLKKLGMPESGLDLCAKMVAKEAYPNPEKVEEKRVRELLEQAYSGIRP